MVRCSISKPGPRRPCAPWPWSRPFELKTSDARRVLPGSFEFKDVVYNVSHSAFFVAAFITGNFSSLRYAMEDRLHQPYREALIPGMRAVFEAAMSRGALSVAISGSGPTLIAFVNSRDREIGEAMRSAWLSEGVECRAIELQPDNEGPVQRPRKPNGPASRASFRRQVHPPFLCGNDNRNLRQSLHYRVPAASPVSRLPASRLKRFQVDIQKLRLYQRPDRLLPNRIVDIQLV